MKKLLSLILVAVMLLTAVPLAFAEGNTYQVGDIIQFGSYPQSEVKDETLIAELNALAPEWDDWTSYGYYSGENETGTMSKNDWMRYTDIVYNGNKYRGVKFNRYRAMYTDSYTSEYGCQLNNSYYKNTVYWFKFENIDWKVIDPNSGLVISNIIIDSQPFCNTIYYKSGFIDYTYGYYNDIDFLNYSNDYETSSIREWLNDSFYSTAFTANEIRDIESSNIESFSVGTLVGDSRYSIYDSNPTNDKIFLLSFDEVTENSFGFSSNSSKYDINRQSKSSDYAKIQGLDVVIGGEFDGCSEWLLRSPGDTSFYCAYVEYNGYVTSVFNVNSTCCGIRPALRLCTHSYISTILKQPTHLDFGEMTYTCGKCGDTYTESIPKLTQHTHNAVVNNPTCTTKGYTTYTCECGDTYKADYVDANGHTFTTYISDSKATCTTDGSLIAKCDYCDATDTKPEKGTHKFSDSFIIDLDPTCTTDGQKSRHCVYCTEKTDITPIGKLAHTYNTITIDSSCTDRGHKIYTCPCGDNYTETIPAKGHNFSGSVCTECDYDKADSCTCNCHKTGLSALIWKILNIFYKLFKTNPTCNCGAAHY